MSGLSHQTGKKEGRVIPPLCYLDKGMGILRVDGLSLQLRCHVGELPRRRSVRGLVGWEALCLLLRTRVETPRILRNST